MKMKWLTLGAMAASGALLLGMLLQHRKKNPEPQIQPKPLDHSPEVRMQAIAAGIRENAHVFEGLYEGLFQAERNRQLFSTDAYEEWCSRVRQLEDKAFADAFAAVFSPEDVRSENLCREKYAALLACIRQAGIRRERENGITCTADEKMSLLYRAVDACPVEIGAAYTVLTAAWICGEKVIEYGMVMKQPAQ